MATVGDCSHPLNMLECDVCEETYTLTGENVPRLLHCRHSLCHSCLSQLPDKNKSILSPFDRQPTQLGKAGVSDLKKNFALIEVLERLQQMSRKDAPVSDKCRKKVKMTCFTLAEDKCNIKPDFTWKIKGNKLRSSWDFKSKVFEWSKYPGVKTWARIDVRGGNNGVAYISLGFKMEAEQFLLTFEQQLTHKGWLTQLMYNVNDVVTIDIYLEPPSTAHEVHSFDGTLDWAVVNYHQRKQMAKRGLVWYDESPYFYTGPKSYRVQMRMWLDRHGTMFRGKGLSVEVCFWTGEFDADLPLTFPHRTAITLINQKDPQQNVTKSVDRDIQLSLSYFIDLCNDEKLENFIENNSVF